MLLPRNDACDVGRVEKCLNAEAVAVTTSKQGRLVNKQIIAAISRFVLLLV